MEKLMILATDESPQVHFDPTRGILDISGKSLPEDIEQFYKPLEDSVRLYIKKPQPTTIISFDMLYLNSSSTKKVLEIVTLFEKLYREGYRIKLNWYHEEFDEDMMEEGQEFSRLTEIPVTLISKSEDQ